MWQKKVKKTIFLLNVADYDPEITKLTYPLIEYYARKIGAQIHVIKDRKFPEWPVTYEKLQIYELAQQMENDWNIYIDSDAVVHPETPDFTLFLPRDTIAHNGFDMANIRWRYDRFFQRDGRNIGSCNWLTIASDLCIELWKPLDDLSIEEALDRIHPTVNEKNTVITNDHLIDDFTLSRNIAKYGLKTKAITALGEEIIPGSNFFWHLYTITKEEKIKQIRQVLRDWEVADYLPEPLRSEIKNMPSSQQRMAQGPLTSSPRAPFPPFINPKSPSEMFDVKPTKD